MSLIIWARCADVSALRRSEGVLEGEGTKHARRTLRKGEPEQPEGKRVELVVCWPAVDVVFVEALADESVHEFWEAGCDEMAGVLAVVLHEHGKGGPEGLAYVVGVDVATTDGLESVVVGAELEGEASGGVAETTGGCGVVETDAKHAAIEMAVCPEAEDGVKVLRGEEDGEDGRWRSQGIVVEVEDYILEYFEGETVYEGGHGGWWV